MIEIQVTLYFKNAEVIDEFTEKLRVEIIGEPRTVEQLVEVIRKEVKSWPRWMES